MTMLHQLRPKEKLTVLIEAVEEEETPIEMVEEVEEDVEVNAIKVMAMPTHTEVGFLKQSTPDPV
jgi:hypothetical protein